LDFGQGKWEEYGENDAEKSLSETLFTNYEKIKDEAMVGANNMHDRFEKNMHYFRNLKPAEKLQLWKPKYRWENILNFRKRTHIVRMLSYFDIYVAIYV
jgi:hypothetical protein